MILWQNLKIENKINGDQDLPALETKTQLSSSTIVSDDVGL
jgi:hypothetical protein